LLGIGAASVSAKTTLRYTRRPTFFICVDMFVTAPQSLHRNDSK
jgi:hypothetical protein